MNLSCNQRISLFLLFAIALLIPIWNACNNHFVRQSVKKASILQIPDALSTNELFMASCYLFKTSSVPEERYAAALTCHELLVRYLRTNNSPLTFAHVIEFLGLPSIPSKESELCYIIYVDNVPYRFRVIAKRPGKVEAIIFNTGVDI